ncbi:alpha/beta hydrolase [Rhizobacter sp. SG703]|uniref:alpha/beta fold hydrolase n=1 Tax=Rhizobacter sp. SG703 TaxID=2587140 RepID=UPI001B2FEF26|nr:alpha/beta hydrolase [Rhizobacter sp. SG703]
MLRAARAGGNLQVEDEQALAARGRRAADITRENWMFDGFKLEFIDVGDVTLRVRHGGRGPALLLLHGHPRTHATWHRVATLLDKRFTVECPDLRGYGQSTKPAPQPDHAQASKRAMAADCAGLMERLGHRQYGVVGHDRGGLVALRLALDVPDRVRRLAILDSLPVVEHLERCDDRFASAWWHWFFFLQPDKPERAILADPDAWYGSNDTKRALMGCDDAWADYLAATRDPATVRAMLEDYRAGPGIDRRLETEDRAAGRVVRCPLLCLWSSRDDLAELHGDPRAIWATWAQDVRGAPVDCGHHMAEEAPDELAGALAGFFGSPTG